MLRLVFTVCMINAPDVCEQREMLVYDEMPAMACVMGAMPELATWRQTHPNWRVARWRCEDDRTAQRSTISDSLAQEVSVSQTASSAFAMPLVLPHPR